MSGRQFLRAPVSRRVETRHILDRTAAYPKFALALAKNPENAKVLVGISAGFWASLILEFLLVYRESVPRTPKTLNSNWPSQGISRCIKRGNLIINDSDTVENPIPFYSSETPAFVLCCLKRLVLLTSPNGGLQHEVFLLYLSFRRQVSPSTLHFARFR